MPYQGSPQLPDPPTPSLLADLRMLDARYDTGPSPTLSASQQSIADWNHSHGSNRSSVSGSAAGSRDLDDDDDDDDDGRERSKRRRSQREVVGGGILGDIRFVTLRERPELAGEVASWLFTEWGHLSNDPDNSPEKLRDRLLAKIRVTTPEDLPVVVVALEVLPRHPTSMTSPSTPSMIRIGGARAGDSGSSNGGHGGPAPAWWWLVTPTYITLQSNSSRGNPHHNFLSSIRILLDRGSKRQSGRLPS
jgi:hypothetical protein